MTQKKIFEKLIEILEKNKKLPFRTKKKILNFRYLDVGFIDSIQIMSLIISIEKTFKIKISARDTESNDFRTVKGLIKIIKKMEKSSYSEIDIIKSFKNLV